QRDLGRLELGQLRQRDLGPRLDLLRVAQLVDDQALVKRAQTHHVLLAARRVRRDADQTGLEHRVTDQLVRALAALVGAQVVALLDVERIDRARRYELLERDR